MYVNRQLGRGGVWGKWGGLCEWIRQLGRGGVWDSWGGLDG